ncbi:MAG: chemotaxis protein CheW [Brevinematales bacterium]|nr:chemotaxis protein CheW [Brevinematales bacterium]
MSNVKQIIQSLLKNEASITKQERIFTYLVATEGEQHFAIPIDYLVEVFEINENNPLISLPLVEEYIRGIVNVRGEIIPALSLNTILGLTCDHSKIHYIIIIQKEFKLGLTFHHVSDLYQIEESKLKPIYHLREHQHHDIIAAEFDIDAHVAQVLDIEGLYESSVVK